MLVFRVVDDKIYNIGVINSGTVCLRLTKGVDDMSVIIIGHVKGDPEKIKQVFASHAADVEAITKTSNSMGAISHRFIQGDGEIVILDEWDTADHFQEFFSSQPMIGQMMEEAGVAGPPVIEVYEALETVGDF